LAGKDEAPSNSDAKKAKTNRGDAYITELRRKAEERLKRMEDRLAKSPDMLAQDVVHELGVHQIELEMQNEELRRAQEDLEASRSKYSYLYDFAPIGYFTCDRRGVIREINLTGAGLMGYERSLLVGWPIMPHLQSGELDVFTDHLRRVFESKEKQACELKLKRRDGSRVDVRLESIAREYGEELECLNAVVDITLQKKFEEQFHDAQKMEAIAILAAGVAHNFNNLLMSILGYTSMLIMQTQKSHPHYEKLIIIERLIESGADLTKKLLGFAREGKYAVGVINVNDIDKRDIGYIRQDEERNCRA
jgi:two-component system cell cycle sensor histidine kinase/response regulator CckA